MAKRIEDYALIGNMRTAALVNREASIEWLCLPRFDSDACFAALLGKRDNGHWQIAPRSKAASTTRRYRGETLVLETVFETADGEAAVIDFMALGEKNDETVHVVRIVEGRRGEVGMGMELILRFDYGRIVPWARGSGNGFKAFSGPDAVRLRAPVELTNENQVTRAEFRVKAGEQIPLVLSHYASFKDAPAQCDAEAALRDTERWWSAWSERCSIEGEWREPAVRSLITLKALTDRETGGLVGAASCGLPEEPGGEANWDYRYTWLRDAALTLQALLNSGYDEEARAWRGWLMRAAAADPAKLQPVYGIGGERRLEEVELDWLDGFEGSRPVRIGNGAYKQKQFDVYGEIMDGLYCAREHGIQPDDDTWGIQRELVHYLESHWQDKGSNIWEGRGPERHFTLSKVMIWLAFDRAVKAVENFGLEGDVERWKGLRQKVHDEVCAKGFDKPQNAFVQYYGGRDLDAALLLMPLVGFLPADDSRIEGTVKAIRENLVYEGFVYRYRTQGAEGGAPASEGAFIICGFWLVDVLILQGKREEALELFGRLLSIRNDVGLLSEEYDPDERLLVGNLPQAFSHVGLINSIHNLL
ncbi:MAG: glycoside hydrolase family 15 protein [Gammaproteobacteria bacterium]|nr:glycoside hydrolase family 15 protein [Gammaproteobacteria bacterium]